ncbi:MAG: DUF6112 family protein [Actinomycetota bacterium]|nr:DUF6112 family protein [Actinomycetota bacterium]MDA8293860.1 DUF6112 family protein [Actinomycetota bacterium]
MTDVSSLVPLAPVLPLSPLSHGLASSTAMLTVLLAPMASAWANAGGVARVARLADVTMSPDTGALPGGHVLQNLVNGIGGWALALALVGLVVGAAAWALGSHGQNYQQAYVGRRAVLVSGLAALLIGAGPALVNFFFHAGQGVR